MLTDLVEEVKVRALGVRSTMNLRISRRICPNEECRILVEGVPHPSTFSSWRMIYPTIHQSSSSLILFTTLPNLSNFNTWDSATYFHQMRHWRRKKQISFKRAMRKIARAEISLADDDNERAGHVNAFREQVQLMAFSGRRRMNLSISAHFVGYAQIISGQSSGHIYPTLIFTALPNWRNLNTDLADDDAETVSHVEASRKAALEGEERTEGTKNDGGRVFTMASRSSAGEGCHA
ncbi:hypothetical protein PSTT_09534 [Puccinia striiformis]|uniref:Uncharacterized protein n=1 Tax=Puccinia striiformis TaxID=27350 RepID=A0A2S4V8E9_9BASI|nr:hypothetical protein PSTT_09534 [Puccinia striiformis]